MTVAVIATAHDFRRACQEARRDGELALVPTMGFLHAGHQSLIQAAAQELETLAGKLSIPLPRDISDKQKSVLAAIKRLSGPEFNTRFVDYNIDEHEVDVKDFNKQLAAASDADVKVFISRMLPMLNAHLDLARAVQQKSKTQ